MDTIYKEFNNYFQEENKEAAVNYILSKLQKNEIDVVDLYMKILTPSLNNLICPFEEERLCIWKEHIKTSIIRTIVECCYPYVIAKREKLNHSKKGDAVVLCPPDEYHDLGARMVSDFFTIYGYNSIYVGGNTPYKDFCNVIDIIHPEIVAISVSNYYHLVATKKMIEEVKTYSKYPIKIVVGGSAFSDDATKYRIVGADYYARSFEDLTGVIGGEKIL